MYYNSIIETIGNTPLIKLNRVAKDVPGTVLVKVEYFNPGNSMKDRMALRMVEAAEASGELKPGGTIIEGTSGNTGMGLALAGIAKGYKCIFTLSDKQSKEKIDILRAVGAEVIVCPTNVAPDDPRSYYSVARKLHAETPNSIYINQYDNPYNATAHYETTGPEIWEQTEGKITHYAAGVGTGGSMCGAAKYLKEQNPKVVSVGIDSYGSVFKKLKETGEFDHQEIYPYMTEGIGEDILPANVDMDLIDHFVKVTDKDAAIMTRRLAREEGLFIGWSCGSAVFGALEYAREHLSEDDVMVVILPDHGTRYLGKVYNDDWMKDHGFLEKESFASAEQIVAKRNGTALRTVDCQMEVDKVVRIFREEGISQMPVVKNGKEYVGAVTDRVLLEKLLADGSLATRPIEEVMEPPLQFVSIHTTVDTLSSLISKEHRPVLVRDSQERVHIITLQDLLGTFVSGN